MCNKVTKKERLVLLYQSHAWIFALQKYPGPPDEGEPYDCKPKSTSYNIFGNCCY